MWLSGVCGCGVPFGTPCNVWAVSCWGARWSEGSSPGPGLGYVQHVLLDISRHSHTSHVLCVNLTRTKGIDSESGDSMSPSWSLLLDVCGHRSGNCTCCWVVALTWPALAFLAYWPFSWYVFHVVKLCWRSLETFWPWHRWMCHPGGAVPLQNFCPLQLPHSSDTPLPKKKKQKNPKN